MALKNLRLMTLGSQYSTDYKKKIVQIIIKLYPTFSETNLKKAAYKCFIVLHKGRLITANGSDVEEQLECDHSILKISNEKIYYRYKFYARLLEGTLTVQMSYMVDFQAVNSFLPLLKKLALKKFAIAYSSIKPLEESFLIKYGKHITSLDLRIQKLYLNDGTLINLLVKCPQLKSLFVQSLNCTAKGFGNLSSLTKLKTLNVYGCKLNDVTLELPASVTLYVDYEGTVQKLA